MIPNQFTIEEEGAPVEDAAPQMTLAEISALMASAASAKSRIQEIEQTAESDRQRIAHWETQATEADRSLVAEVSAQVEAYARRRLQELQQGDKKGFSTAYGNVTVVERQPAPVRENEVALREWAEAHGMLRPVEPPEPAVDWKAVKDRAKKGERIPGVTFDEGSTTVTVEFWR